MGRAMFAILAVLCFSWATAEEAVNPPPRPLHKVNDHWTPYEPPKELPPDAQVYIIQKGDTLWDLAKKFLNNPLLWPQIWEKNKYIRDAHWIYPGDPLIVGVKAEEVAPPPAPEQPQAPAAPVTEGTPAPGAAARPPGAQGPAGELVAIGSEDDIYCFAYLDEKNSKAQLTITSAEEVEDKDNYSTNDIVYVSGGDAEGVKAGQEYFIVIPVRKLHHPATGAVLGTVMRYLGQLRVLCTQEHTATGEIVASCDAVQLGAWLKPFDPIPIPMTILTPAVTRCDPASTKARGYIVYDKDDLVAFGKDHVVLIDLGEADQVAPGTQCIIYRDNPVPGAPRLLLGEAAVLTTGDHWASAKIIRSYQQMYVGDRIELK
jgi:LysM repeat protein